MNSWIIRPFKMNDYASVLRVWGHANLPHKPRGRDNPEMIKKELKLGTAIFYVAELNGEIVGTALGTHDGRKGWINRLAVIPEHQRRGIARALIQTIEDKLESMGILIIATLIEKGNIHSEQVAQSLGFTHLETIQYYSIRKHQDV